MPNPKKTAGERERKRKGHMMGNSVARHFAQRVDLLSNPFYETHSRGLAGV